MAVQGEGTELTREEQLDQEWDKLDAAEKAIEEDKSNSDGLSDKTDPLEDDANKADTLNVPSDSDNLKKESDHQAESADAKALKDTKAWATKLAQENAELKRLAAEGASMADIANQQRNVDQAKRGISNEALETVYREYPEMKEVFNPLLDTLKDLKAETDASRRQREDAAIQTELNRKQEAVSYFESTIMPKVIDGGHPDFKEIIAGSAYFEWADKQRPGLKTAALQSNDPEDIKWALTEYKKSLAGAEAGKLKQTDAEKRQHKLNNQMTLRGGSSTLSSGKSKDDPSDYDAAWDKAEAEERRNR